MSVYTPVDPNLAGAATALVAVSASDTFPNNGAVLLHVKNASGVSTNVTIVDQQGAAEQALIPNATALNGNVVVAVAAGAEKFIGPFKVARFNDATGAVTVQYSATATVTAEAIDAN